MLKAYFRNLIKTKKDELTKKETERNALIQENETVTDIERAKQINKELRAVGETLAALRKEIDDAEKQLAEVEKDDGNGNGEGAGAGEGRSVQLNGTPFNPVATYGQGNGNGDVRSDVDPLATMEYRKAFKDYLQRGVENKILKRAASENVTADLGILLPKTITDEIIKGVEKIYGKLTAKVKKTNFAGGVQIPIGAFAAKVYWDGTAADDKEHGVSEKQNAGKITGYVQFTYHIGEIRVAQSLLQSIITVDAFEKELINAVLEAYAQAMDDVVLSGDGAKQGTGILTEAEKGTAGRIPAANIIEFTEADMADWKQFQKKLFAKIPLSMRKLRPEFVMTAETWESNIMTLVDKNDRPVARETYNPETGDEVCKFKGRHVELVEEGGIKSFDTAAAGEYFAMYWVPEKAYAINSNMQFSYKKYFDEDTNQYVTKALVICDGQVVDGKYIYLLKKKA